jgi:5'(3')-deoxyribonucleotidase
MTSWVNWSEHRLEAMKALKTLDDILEEEKIPSWDLKDRVKFAQGVIMKLTQENNRLASVTQKKEYITLRLPKKEES